MLPYRLSAAGCGVGVGVAIESIVVVSGLPRSGTSLAMQMLAAARMPIQQDGVRVADESNERGYFEWERVKHLPRDPKLIADCGGQAVKIVSSLLPLLPEGWDYRIILMERQLADVHASQMRMIGRSETPGGVLSPERMMQALAALQDRARAWIASRSYPCLGLEFERLIDDPLRESRRLAEFLALGDDAANIMACVVEARLRHHGRG